MHEVQCELAWSCNVRVVTLTCSIHHVPCMKYEILHSKFNHDHDDHLGPIMGECLGVRVYGQPWCLCPLNDSFPVMAIPSSCMRIIGMTGQVHAVHFVDEIYLPRTTSSTKSSTAQDDLHSFCQHGSPPSTHGFHGMGGLPLQGSQIIASAPSDL